MNKTKKSLHSYSINKAINILKGNNNKSKKKHYIKNNKCTPLRSNYIPKIQTGFRTRTNHEKLTNLYKNVFKIYKDYVTLNPPKEDYIYENKILCEIFKDNIIENPEILYKSFLDYNKKLKKLNKYYSTIEKKYDSILKIVEEDISKIPIDSENSESINYHPYNNFKYIIQSLLFNLEEAIDNMSNQLMLYNNNNKIIGEILNNPNIYERNTLIKNFHIITYNIKKFVNEYGNLSLYYYYIENALNKVKDLYELLERYLHYIYEIINNNNIELSVADKLRTLNTVKNFYKNHHLRESYEEMIFNVEDYNDRYNSFKFYLQSYIDIRIFDEYENNSDDEFRELTIIELLNELQEKYFPKTYANIEIHQSYQELLALLNKLDSEKEKEQENYNNYKDEWKFLQEQIDKLESVRL